MERTTYLRLRASRNFLWLTDADKDESSAYNNRRYKLLLSESMFETIETYYPRGSDKPNKVYRTKWKVTDKGAFVQVK